MEVIRDVVIYILGGVLAWVIWATKKIYDLDKEQALNSQNDAAVSKAINNFQISIDLLTKEINNLKITIAEEFGGRNRRE